MTRFCFQKQVTEDSGFCLSLFLLLSPLLTFPELGNGNPLQYSSLENSMDRGAWQATVHGAAKSQTGLSD